MLLAVGGSRFFDPAFLAARSDALLLSDDMRFRELSTSTTGVNGIWLQAALLATAELRLMSPSDYAKAVVGLAHHGHDHLVLNGPLLYLIARQDEDHLPGLRAALRFLGGRRAEMNSHFNVLVDFIARVWQSGNVLGWLKIRAVTGLSLEAFLGNRSDDWRFWLQQILDWGSHNRRPSDCDIFASS